MLVLGWFYLAVLTLASLIFGSLGFAAGVAAGGIIAMTSFSVAVKDLQRFVDSVAAEDDHAAGNRSAGKGKKGLIIKFWLRIFLIGVVLLVLLKSGVNVFGLLLGLTTVVFTVTLSGVGAAWRYYHGRR